MKDYHFTIQYDEFHAEIVLTGEYSLYEFAEFILATVGFDFDHAFEFCDNLKNPYRSKERYTLFADIGEEADDPGVQKTPVSAVFRPRKMMLFHFDYGDDWFFLITCTAVGDSSSKRRARKVVSMHGTPPEQYPDPDE